MSGIEQWSGREARELRLALRKSIRDFAEYLRLSPRTITKWEQGGTAVTPTHDSQALLDTALARAGESTRERFFSTVTKQKQEPVLSGPHGSESATILIPPIPFGTVSRGSEHSRLLEAVARSARGAGSDVIAVYGPGGFGKTTMVTELCHDNRVRELFDAVLWVELGEHCTPGRIAQLISDLCVHLEGGRAELRDTQQAAFHLAQLLAGRRTLLVVDNVWAESDLAPFLLTGSDCVKLVTTRNAAVCPTHAARVRLGTMDTDQVGTLFEQALSLERPIDIGRLARQCGGWPLLATVLAAGIGRDIADGASAERATARAVQMLESFGPTGLREWSVDERSRAIGQVVASSLDNLEEHVAMPDASRLRERYVSLAVFPPSTPIPVPLLARWWAGVDGWAESTVRWFCRVLSDRCLIQGYQADTDTIMLHDVFRSHLRQLIGDAWQRAHRSLLDAYRGSLSTGWSSLDADDDYLWRYLTYHLQEAGLDEELTATVSDPDYLIAKAIAKGHQALTVDRHAVKCLPDQSSARVRTARSMTSAGYLLAGAVERHDLAASLHVAVTKDDGDAATKQRLDEVIAEASTGFRALWADALSTAESAEVGHVGAVTTVSSSTTTIVSAGEDGTVRIRRRDQAEPPTICRGHTGWVYATAIAATLHVVASAGDDGVIRVWSLSTGEPVAALAGHEGRTRALSFANSGRLLVSGGEDGLVRIWDVERKALVYALREQHAVWAVDISSNDQMLASAGASGTVALHKLATFELHSRFEAHTDWIRALAFHPDAAILATGSGDGDVCVLDVAGPTPNVMQRISTSTRVRALVWDETGRRLTVTGEDAIVRTFDLADGEPSATTALPGHVDWIRSVGRLGADETVLGAEDGSIHSWALTSATPPARLSAGQNTVWSTAFHAGTGEIVTGGGNGRLALRDRHSGTARAEYGAGDGRVWALAAGGDYLAAACGDGQVRVWTGHDERPCWELHTSEHRTWAVAVDCAGHLLAASAGDGTVRMWDLDERCLRWENSVGHGRIRSIAFDHLGTRMATAGGDGAAQIWDAVDGTTLRTIASPNGWVRTVALSQSGEMIAVGTGAGDIHLHECGTGRVLAHAHGHQGRVLAIAINEEAGRMISAAADGTVRNWDLDGRPTATVRLDATLQCAAIDQDALNAIAASATGLVAVGMTGIV